MSPITNTEFEQTEQTSQPHKSSQDHKDNAQAHSADEWEIPQSRIRIDQSNTFETHHHQEHQQQSHSEQKTEINRRIEEVFERPVDVSQESDARGRAQGVRTEQESDSSAQEPTPQSHEQTPPQGAHKEPETPTPDPEAPESQESSQEVPEEEPQIEEAEPTPQEEGMEHPKTKILAPASSDVHESKESIDQVPVKLPTQPASSQEIPIEQQGNRPQESIAPAPTRPPLPPPQEPEIPAPPPTNPLEESSQTSQLEGSEFVDITADNQPEEEGETLSRKRPDLVSIEGDPQPSEAREQPSSILSRERPNAELKEWEIPTVEIKKPMKVVDVGMGSSAHTTEPQQPSESQSEELPRPGLHEILSPPPRQPIHLPESPKQPSQTPVVEIVTQGTSAQTEEPSTTIQSTTTTEEPTTTIESTTLGTGAPQANIESQPELHAGATPETQPNAPHKQRKFTKAHG